MSPHAIQQLTEAVQTNCHIADAAHAADMTLCIYLLQMREFYRWEQGIAPLASMPREQVGAWLTERETLWNTLEERPFVPLSLAGVEHDPFDVAGINAVLLPHGLVYGAGQTAPGRASFFLGELQAVQRREGATLYVCGREHARGLAAPPAALQDRVIFLRQESLRRWLWEKYEAWTLRRPAGAFQTALDAYGHAQDGSQAVERMAQAQAETLVLHELGEARADELLGPAWAAMRQSLNERRIDLHLRAARDLLADCLVTLPTLLERQADASLHFWFANFDGLRETLFPQLNQAYAAWCGGDGGAELWRAVSQGAPYWQGLCERALALYETDGPAAQAPIRTLFDVALSERKQPTAPRS